LEKGAGEVTTPTLGNYPDKSGTYVENFEKIPANLKMKTFFHTNPNTRKRKNFSEDLFLKILCFEHLGRFFPLAPLPKLFCFSIAMLQ